MKYVEFILFSSFEYFVIILLGMSLFRFQNYRKHLTSAYALSAILSFISLSSEIFLKHTLNPLIQMLIIYLLSLAFFRQRKMYTLLLSVVPYLIYGLFQSAVLLTMVHFKLTTFSDIKPFSYNGWLLQVITAASTFAVIMVIKLTNEGYSFDPDVKTKKKYKYNNKLIFMILLFSIALIIGSFMELQISHDIKYISVYFISALISCISLLYISLMRDKEEFL